jgi:small subunit ribosomal protein S1
VVKEGQKLELMVLKIDKDTRKISLGLKQVMPDPWMDVEVKYPVDTVLTGRVTRLMEFGAFVELEPGVEGLVPISEMTYERRIAHPREVVQEGEVIRARVIKLDAAARKIALSIKQVGDDPWVGASVRWPVNTVASGTVKRVAAFGAFVELIPGVEGLVHISELSDQRVRSVSDVVKEGQTIQAKVLEVDEEGRRIGLSIAALSVAALAVLSFMGTPWYGVSTSAEQEAVATLLPQTHPGPLREADWEALQLGSYTASQHASAPNAEMAALLETFDEEVQKVNDATRGDAEGVMVIEDWQTDLKKVTLRVVWTNLADGSPGEYSQAAYLHSLAAYDRGGGS